eukprot:scaffold2079_cov142-Skeletonema_marinoi.AAC.3
MNIVEVENEAVQQEESRSTSFGAARRTPDSRHLQYTMTIRCFDSGNFSFYYMGFEINLAIDDFNATYNSPCQW